MAPRLSAETVSVPSAAMANFADSQLEIYMKGLEGIRPGLPVTYAELERRAHSALDPMLVSYVAGGAGNERTQDANVTAFDRWGLIPRVLVGAADRDLSVEFCGLALPTPIFMAPIGVIGLCAQDGHGDLATARTAAATGIPMVASTLSVDPLWLRSLTSLPLILKGICHPDDVRRAIEGGVDAIYCSTHGGRQANGGIGALDMLAAVVDAAGDLPVLFDSGVRSGDHIVTALALGATAVGIGRPYAWGLALGGADGIEHVLRCLLAEADLLMAVDGYPTLDDLTRDALLRLG